MITGIQLRAICQIISVERANTLAITINNVSVKYGLTNHMLQEFIANLAHESAEFNIKTEGLNYSSAQRIIDVWPSRFNLTGLYGKLNANNYVHNAVKLANAVYNGRMGNIPGTNDGYNFRGGSFAQITGRDAYTLYTAYVNRRSEKKYTINDLADLVRTSDEWAMDCSAWFFCEFKNLEEAALQDNFLQIVKKWNGGFIGLADRQKYYTRALKVIKK